MKRNIFIVVMSVLVLCCVTGCSKALTTAAEVGLQTVPAGDEITPQTGTPSPQEVLNTSEEKDGMSHIPEPAVGDDSEQDLEASESAVLDGKEPVQEEVGPAEPSETAGVSVNTYLPKLGLGSCKVSSEPVILETERFVINIGPDIVYSKELSSFVEDILNRIEDETSLSFYPQGKEYEKIQINVVDSKHSTAFGSELGVTVAPIDMFIDGGTAAFPFVHELSHTLQMRNCKTNSQVFMESFATLNTSKIVDKLMKPSLFNSYMNYSYFENENEMVKNPEPYFLEVAGWDAYLAGFRVAVYLEEVYGSSIYPEIIREIGEKYTEEPASTGEVVETIKSLTSDSVLTEFSSWYEANIKRFSSPDPNMDLRKCKSLDVYPVYNNVVKNYYIPSFKYSEEITLDFRDGFGYLQYLGYQVKGIYGSVYSEGEHTLDFYDVEGKLISTKKIAGSSTLLDTIGAVRIEVSGDGSSIEFLPVLSKMVDMEQD